MLLYGVAENVDIDIDIDMDICGNIGIDFLENIVIDKDSDKGVLRNWHIEHH